MLAAGIVALAAPALARAYGWPLKPFDRQHAIRGAFDDPREHVGLDGAATHSFHFGVDISASDGAPVYAVEPGTVYREPDAVAVRRADGHEFSYWHVVAAVREHAHVVAGELIGTVRPGWGHVHLAESIDGVYVNPLRPGGLEPFADTTVPVVQSIQLSSQDLPVDPARVEGRVDIVAEAFDPPPIAPPPPWQDAVWTPSLVRWRIERDGREVVPWETVVAFSTLLEPWQYDLVYAPGTRQNHPDRPGRFRFWLARGFDTALLPDGDYRLEVAASDTRGNTGRAALDLTIANRGTG